VFRWCFVGVTDYNSFPRRIHVAETPPEQFAAADYNSFPPKRPPEHFRGVFMSN
jgi:hypothetical protein